LYQEALQKLIDTDIRVISDTSSGKYVKVSINEVQGSNFYTSTRLQQINSKGGKDQEEPEYLQSLRQY
jgi:hypothetical protein